MLIWIAIILGFVEDSDDSGTFSCSIIYEPNSAVDPVGRANTTAEDYLNNPITADKLGISGIVTEDGANKQK